MSTIIMLLSSKLVQTVLILVIGILVPKYRQNLYIVYLSFLGGFSLN